MCPGQTPSPQRRPSLPTRCARLEGREISKRIFGLGGIAALASCGAALLSFSPAQAQTAGGAAVQPLPPIVVQQPKAPKVAPKRVQPSKSSQARAPSRPRRIKAAARPAAPVAGGATTAGTTNPGAAAAPSPGQGGRYGTTSALQPLGPRLPEAQSIHQVTTNVSVVDRGQIEQTDPTSLLDILGMIPGVSIARSGGIGGQIYIRGFSSNNMRSPIFVDGDRLHGRNTLQFDYFDPEEIERVEIIRGPASVLYGSDALTGVVNIITRQPTGDPTGPFRFTGGGTSVGFSSNGPGLSTYEWAQGAGEGFNIRGGASYRESPSYETVIGRAKNSDYRIFDGDLKLRYSPVADQHLQVSFLQSNETDGRAGGVGGAPGYPFLQVRQTPNTLTSGRVDYSGDFPNSFFAHVDASAYINYFDTQLITINESATKFVGMDSHVKGPTVVGGRILGVIPWDLNGFGTITTKIGADTFNEARPGSTTAMTTAAVNKAGVLTGITAGMLTTQVVPDSGQTNVGAVALTEWTPVAPLTISAGGRGDFFNTTTLTSPLPTASAVVTSSIAQAYQSNSNTDRGAPTGSIGAVYRITRAFDLVADIQNAFRQPTNAELFGSSGTSIPNPFLKPETNVTYEGGVRGHITAASAGVTVFHSLYQNLIQTQGVANMTGITSNTNVGFAQVDGVELEGRYQFTRTLNLFGNLTALRGTNKSTGVPLPYIAPFQAQTGLQYVAPDAPYSLEGIIDWALSKKRIDPTMEYPTSGYAVVNLHATFQLGRLVSSSLGDTRLSLGVDNLLDTAYASAATFVNPAFGRTLTNPLVEPGRNFTTRVTHTF